MQTQKQHPDILDNAYHQIRFYSGGGGETSAGDIDAPGGCDRKQDDKKYKHRPDQQVRSLCLIADNQQNTGEKLDPGHSDRNIVDQFGGRDTIMMDQLGERQGVDDFIDCGVNKQRPKDYSGDENDRRIL